MINRAGGAERPPVSDKPGYRTQSYTRYAMHEERGPWVVYFKAQEGKLAGIRAVCGQAEWDAMERAKPGALTLIRGGIANESEAELLARGTSGDRPSESMKKKVAASSAANTPC